MSRINYRYNREVESVRHWKELAREGGWGESRQGEGAGGTVRGCIAVK